MGWQPSIAPLQRAAQTYDGENRPLTVAYAGRTTSYVYGADGARLKKVETDPVTGQASVTLYMGPVEIRKWSQGTAEEILLYPAPNIRITKTNPGSGVVTKVNTLHADGLGSVRAVTDETGLAAERSTYRPFGEEAEQALSLTTPKETRGFIGERFDDTSGLQYLNARYYDPKLGMFIQPDWWEVMKEGVGTNRYSYALGDPVNGRDPGGNGFVKELLKDIARALSGNGHGDGIERAASAAVRETTRDIKAFSRSGIDAAWKQEMEIVKAGSSGTRRWSKEELEMLREGKIPPGYHGHHINSVASNPKAAGLANNIEFLTQAEHNALHVEKYGGYQNPTSGASIDRGAIYRELAGNDLPASTRERLSYEGFLDRAATRLGTILNSRTMMVIDMLDPVTWTGWAYEAETGRDFWTGGIVRCVGNHCL